MVKVFVGNLSFKTQESDLAKEFAVAGKVETANIISRGSRSLGYGFVEFATEEEAKKSVELLNKKLIDSREINVEVARPRDETAAAQPRQPRAPRAPRQAANNAAGGAAAPAAGGVEGAGEGRVRRAPRPRRTRKPRAEGAPAAGGEGAPKQEGERAPRPPRERAPRQPKPEGERAPRTASPNTLFVANLPFSVDDTGLAEIFAGLNLKTAHVVRKRNNRSKGFGFVEFNSADDQAKALQAVDKKKVQERELIVKAALTEAPAAAGEKAAAPAAAAPAAAVSSPKPN